MNKVSITIDLACIDKVKIIEGEYKRKDGVTIKTKKYNLDLVPLKNPEVVKSGDGWVLKKTHFVCEPQTKEERLAKTKTIYLGSGYKFEKVAEAPKNTANDVEYPDDDINAEDIPF